MASSSKRPDDPHVSGFWLKLDEAAARAVAKGHLPKRVRGDVEAMMDDYDAHLRAAEQQLAKRRTR